MLFASENPAINQMMALDGDILVDNFMSKSILPGISQVETTLLDDLSISVKAGILGMANNAMNIGNALGGDFDTYDIAASQGDLKDAYLANKDNYDLFGDIITSLVPGGIAFQGLKLAKLGKLGGVMEDALGVWERKSVGSLQQAAGLYRNIPKAAEIKALKRQSQLYSTLDELQTGIIISGAIEATQHLGSLMVDEGKSAGEKFIEFTGNSLFGGLIGAPFGLINYYSNLNKILKPAESYAKKLRSEILYQPYVTKATGQVGVFQGVTTHILDQMDQIDAYVPKDEAFQVGIDKIKSTQLGLARDDLDKTLGRLIDPDIDISAKGSDIDKDVLKAVQNLVHTSMSTTEGRASARNLLQRVNKLDVGVDDQQKLIMKALTEFQDFDQLLITGKSDEFLTHGDDLLMGINPVDGKPYMKLNGDSADIIKNFDRYQVLNRILTPSIKANEDLATYTTELNNMVHVLPKFDGVKPPNTFFEKLDFMQQSIDNGNVDKYINSPLRITRSHNSLLSLIDNAGAKDYLFGSNRYKFIDVDSGDISVHGITTLYGEAVGGRALVKHLTRDTSLRSVQESRLRLSSDKNPLSLDKATAKTGQTPIEIFKIEGGILRAHKDKSPFVMFAKNKALPIDEAYEKVYKVKRRYAKTLLSRHNYDDVSHTLGIKNLDKVLQNPKYDSGKISPDDFIGDPKDLTKLKQVRAQVDTAFPDMEDALLVSSVASQRADELATMAVAGSQSISVGGVARDLADTLPAFPDLGFVDELDGNRLVFDSHVIGDIDGAVAGAVHAGDQVQHIGKRLNTEYRAGVHMDDLEQASLDSVEAAADYLNYENWFFQQPDKFFTMKEPDGSIILIRELDAEKFAADGAGSISKFEDAAKAAEAPYFKFTDGVATERFKAIQSINQNRVVPAKGIQEQAYHNKFDINPKHVFNPPKHFPFVRYFRVSENSVLDQHSSQMLRVTGNTAKEIEERVAEAELQFAKKGQSARLLSNSDVKTNRAHKLEFLWDGQDLDPFSSRARRGNGDIPDANIGTIQDSINKDKDWIQYSARGIANNAVQLHYAEPVSRLSSLIRAEKNTNFYGADTVQGQADNAAFAGTYEQIHLAMSGQDYPSTMYNKMNNFVSDKMAAVFQTPHEWRMKLKAKYSKAEGITRADIMEVDKATKKLIAERGGVDPLGDALEQYVKTQTELKGQDINEAVAGLQMITSTLLLRLDGVDPLMNTLGMTVKLGSELKYIDGLVSADIAKKGSVDEVYKKWFGAGEFRNKEGTKLSMMSAYKATAVGTADMFNGKATKFLDELDDLGLVTDDIRIMSELIDDLPIPAHLSTPAQKARFFGKLRDNVGKSVNFLTKPHQASVMLTQYTALKVAFELADAAGLERGAKVKFMNMFNKRVNAIGSATSKPRLFQGLVGNAVSLYQNYFFHTLGNVFRYAKSGQNSAILRNVAMNSTFFGAQTAPGFDFINTQVGSTHDRNHADVYTATYSALPTWAADFIMFGAASTMLQSNLAGRGDFTPRHLTILPTNPADLPIVSAVANTLGAIVENSAKLVTGRATLDQAMMNTVIDSKLNRPLTGLMQALSGRSTDSRYSLNALHDDFLSWSTIPKVMGVKPLDEARVTQAYWNLQAYRVADQAKTRNLGEVMRLELAARPGVVDDPEWMNEKYAAYTKAGGNEKGFKRFYTSTILKGETTFEQRLQRSMQDVDLARNYRALLDVE